MSPDAVYPYLWLLCLALLLLNIWSWYRRAGELVVAGRVTAEERRAFARRLAAGAALFCLALQTIVWVTGEARPACLAAFPPRTPASQASSIVTLLLWVALLWWVWSERGAEQLARLAPAFWGGRVSARRYTVAQVRRAVVGFVVISALVAVGSALVVPADASCLGSR